MDRSGSTLHVIGNDCHFHLADVAAPLGASYAGAGSTPEDLTSAAECEAYSCRIDHLGAQAAQRGMRYVVHLHGTDFESVDDGASAFQFLLDRTSPQNVVFELDLYWAVSAGDGTIDLPAVFAAAGDAIEYYVIERDPPLGDDDFDPFTPSFEGLRYLQRVHF